MTDPVLTQTAPWPHELADLVQRWRYRPGWTFTLFSDFVRDRAPDGTVLARGTTLDIQVIGYNAYHPEQGENYGPVHHYRIVPAATYNRQSWRRWLFEECLIVDRHEGCEFAATGDLCGACSGRGRLTIRGFGDLDDEDHECAGCGGLGLVNVVHPFAPNHGPGYDPYRVVEYETDDARRTSFRGTLNPTPGYRLSEDPEFSDL